MTGRGELERAVLQILWDAPEPLTARAVAAALPGRELAPTTVLTVLGRLRRKKLVIRDETMYPNRFAPKESREDHIVEIMMDALGEAPDRSAVLNRFIGGMSDADAGHLRQALRRPRSSS